MGGVRLRISLKLAVHGRREDGVRRTEESVAKGWEWNVPLEWNLTRY